MKQTCDHFYDGNKFALENSLFEATNLTNNLDTEVYIFWICYWIYCTRKLP